MEIVSPQRRPATRSPSKWNPSPSKTQGLPLAPQPPNVQRLRPWERKAVPSRNPAKKGKKVMKRIELQTVKTADLSSNEENRGDGCWVLNTPDRERRTETVTGKRRLLGDLVGPIPAHWTKIRVQRSPVKKSALILEVDAPFSEGEMPEPTRKRRADGELVVREDEDADTERSIGEDGLSVSTNEAQQAGDEVLATPDAVSQANDNTPQSEEAHDEATEVDDDVDMQDATVIDEECSEDATEDQSFEESPSKSPRVLLESSELDLADDTITIDVSKYLREDTLTVDVRASSSSPYASQQEACEHSPEDDASDNDCSYGSEFFTDSILETSQLEDNDDEGDIDDKLEGRRVPDAGDATVTFNAPMPATPLSPVRARLEFGAKSSPFFDSSKPESELSGKKFKFSPALKFELSPSKIPLPDSPASDSLGDTAQLDNDVIVACTLWPSSDDEGSTSPAKKDTIVSGGIDSTTNAEGQDKADDANNAPVQDEETASLYSFLDRVRNSRAARAATTMLHFGANEPVPVPKFSFEVPLTSANSEDIATVKSSESIDDASQRAFSKPAQGTRRSQRSTSTTKRTPAQISIGPGQQFVATRVSIRTAAQELALVTKSNTRQNRGDSNAIERMCAYDEQVTSDATLEKEDEQSQGEEESSAAPPPPTLTKQGRPRKTVVWDEVLVRFKPNDDPPALPPSPPAEGSGSSSDAAAVEAQITTETLAASPVKLSPTKRAIDIIQDHESEVPLLASPPKKGTKAPAKKAPNGRNGTRGTPARRRSSLSLGLLAEDSFAALPPTSSSSSVGTSSPAKASITAASGEGPSTRRTPARRKSLLLGGPAASTRAATALAKEPSTATTTNHAATAAAEEGSSVAAFAGPAKPKSRLPAPSAGKKTAAAAAAEPVKRVVGGTPAKRRRRA